MYTQDVVRLPEREKPSSRGQSTLPVLVRSLIRLAIFMSGKNHSFPIKQKLSQGSSIECLYVTIAFKFCFFLLSPRQFMVPWF